MFMMTFNAQVMRYPHYYKNESRHVRIRISLDGARFSRASSYCLLSFAFLRKNDFSLSPADLCTIAAIKGDETHEQLSVGFKNVFDDINQYLENPLFTTEEDIIHNTSPADEWDVEIDIMDTVVLEQQHGRMQLLMTRLILLMHFVPLDEQMICDIQKIASRLAAKSSQLIGHLTNTQIRVVKNESKINALAWSQAACE
ncbi:uncharacterized protein [Dysidea avara]|uniref:uncharacterized protein isoform X2 n=1 Tax=Dysidea avara TaxID=196820 RepID=UPI003329FBD7